MMKRISIGICQRERDPDNHHYLQIKFEGDSLNKDGLGAWAELHYDQGKQQVYENTPLPGLSFNHSGYRAFWLGKISTVDSVIIKWPNGKMQLLRECESKSGIASKY